MSEADYTRLTYHLTLGWAQMLARANPGMTFIYVSGMGTGGKAMWAQVKRSTEDALLVFPERIHVPLGHVTAYARRGLKDTLDADRLRPLWPAATADTGGCAGISHQHRGTGTRHDPSGTAGSPTAGVGESRHDCAWGNRIGSSVGLVQMQYNSTVNQA